MLRLISLIYGDLIISAAFIVIVTLPYYATTGYKFILGLYRHITFNHCVHTLCIVRNPGVFTGP